MPCCMAMATEARRLPCSAPDPSLPTWRQQRGRLRHHHHMQRILQGQQAHELRAAVPVARARAGRQRQLHEQLPAERRVQGRGHGCALQALPEQLQAELELLSRRGVAGQVVGERPAGLGFDVQVLHAPAGSRSAVGLVLRWSAARQVGQAGRCLVGAGVRRPWSAVRAVGVGHVLVGTH